MTSENRPRRRDAAATRAAILSSAREVFARLGYDGAGLREIAAGAGVTAMLVNRYFGGKEQLFAEAIAAANSAPIIATERVLKSEHPGAAIAEALVQITAPGAKPLDGFLILLNSASSARAARIGREVIEVAPQKTVAAMLEGENVEQRAALILSLVAGFQMMRQEIGLGALADSDPKVLVDLLAPLFERLVKDV
ncbi:TetR/AcrR family transcriptional regulator [Ancylobacter mangrovi]|uniref:TetR/AcrR family transcriptional regulator n=1 Tax=Ancylobacter mangrovi TaxID=2972472 RepID=UPI002161444F|nr:TetR/AcrR family transcriptional regulator [Ancylobacter mangrovi]MCS0502693.1 TetR family transcriptional regulator [Ancylobacter mangrovi]